MRHPVLFVLMALMLPLAASAEMHGDHSHDMGMMAPTVIKAVAVIHPTAGNNVMGTVSFTQEADGVRVMADVHGLTPGKHGFHIHQWGDCTAADGTSAGGHFNPSSHPHAGPMDGMRHAGDLGNLEADESGHATMNWLDPTIQLNGASGIVGRGVIVHAGEDDLSSQPTGAAGARVGCGVIGIAKDGTE